MTPFLFSIVIYGGRSQAVMVGPLEIEVKEKGFIRAFVESARCDNEHKRSKLTE